MDPLLYFFADLYPWWGIPLAIIFVELANIYRRRRSRKPMVICLGISGVFASLAVLYFVYNGFFHLRPAMQTIERSMSNK